MIKDTSVQDDSKRGIHLVREFSIRWMTYHLVAIVGNVIFYK